MASAIERPSSSLTERQNITLGDRIRAMDDFFLLVRCGLFASLFGASAEPVRGLWRDGKLLVMHKGAVLPDRCIKCNAPAGGLRLKRSLSWHESKYFSLGKLHPLLYLVVALLVRKTAKIELGICRRHCCNRLMGMAIGWALFFLGVAAIAILAARPPRKEAIQVVLALSGTMLLWGGPVCAAVFYPVVRPLWIDDEHIWLTGTGSDYLAEFPPIPDAEESQPLIIELS